MWCSDASQKVSVIENSIVWRIMGKEETFHAFLIFNLSQQVLLSNKIAVFIGQLEIYKDHCFSFFLCMLRSTQMRNFHLLLKPYVTCCGKKVQPLLNTVSKRS